VEIYAKRFLRHFAHAIVVMGKMEDIREIIKATDMRDRDAIAEAKERIRQILLTKAEYIRDITRMCLANAEVMISALQHNDTATAERMCDIVVREANNLITKGVDLARDIEKADKFGRW